MLTRFSTSRNGGNGAVAGAAGEQLPCVCPGAVSPIVCPPGCVPAGAVSPIQSVLEDLRGRDLSLLVDGREVAGKLISASPPTVVSKCGTVTVVDPAAIQSVSY